ncbi:PhzF family phenazine biosynthesis protein [Pseudoalteromonas xiamenensis]|uniref:PhzF family phenazine biosynthesis protein n=1 Tax=Pseudoalteromonas xiamenensis TaxID=882626 RepID=UPI0035EB23D4
MEIAIYQIDAFASQVFSGNPAAVCPLAEWLEDGILQSIAEANNLSETAFFVVKQNLVELRWFTPNSEVDLCGHATLAAAHVLFQHLNYSRPAIRFQTRSGELVVEKTGDAYTLNFPASMPTPVAPPPALIEGLGVTPKAVYCAFDYIVELEDEASVKSLEPNLTAWKQLDKRGVVVTAPGLNVDFVSRCFFPRLDVDEDPVTGSAHCEIAPLWSKVLQKQILQAKQCSKRGGKMTCIVESERVTLIGHAVDYMKGTITLE